VFTASGTVFTIKEGTKAVVPLTNSRVKVSTLSFQNISSASSTDKIIRISFVIDYATSSGKSEYTFTKAFSGSATLR
jgi:fibronectin type 3 domain-containing protein